MVYAALTDAPANPVTGIDSLPKMFNLVMNVVLGTGIALTTIYLVLGGIKYVTSQGDQKNTQTAREWLTNAVIGFIIIIGAFAIKTIVGKLLGAGSLDISGVNS